MCSMPYSNTATGTKEEICALLHSRGKEIVLNFPDVHKQKGGNHCGAFAIAYATTLFTDSTPTKVNYDQLKFRKHLYECIQKGDMSPFPRTPTQRRMLKQSPQETVQIFCSCRQPESGTMVQCDNCLEWYHERCIQIPENIEQINWSCSSCANILVSYGFKIVLLLCIIPSIANGH